MPAPRSELDVRISADIGGTFTDLVRVDRQSGRVVATKVSSRPEQPAEGVLEGLRELLPEPARLESLIHGQTVGLNAFLERRGARVLLLTTTGLRDSYTIARHHRQDLYALQYSKPERLIPRRDTFEVVERLNADGSVEIPFERESLAPAIARIEAGGVDAVAVCLLHSYLNSEHELAVREALLERFPQLTVSISSEVVREWREYERASSAVLNAYVAPSIERYLLHLEAELKRMGVEAPVRIMQSNGGVTSTRRARRQPIQTLLSGPVGGTIAAARLAEATGRANLLCADMGGTSFDMSLVIDGSPSSANETELEGLPLLLPLIDIHTIGAGGGSVGWLEAGGLRVGPRSAGANPGPACYGRGGTEPTVTDANLALGRLDTQHFLGGRMLLDADAADAALRTVADQIGLDRVELAEGMLKIVNAAMADAMRTITVRRGIDPREFSLVAFGGAGPMHAVALAEELEMREVVVPWSPGTFSAWGMLQTDVQQDFSYTFYRPLAGLDPDEVQTALAELEREGAAALGEDGQDRVGFIRSADLRYVGQEYAVNVPIGPAELGLDCLAERFHHAHRSRYGHARESAAVEFVNLRIAAIGTVDRWRFEIDGDHGEAAGEPARQEVVFKGVAHEAPTLFRRELAPGMVASGPALIHEGSATTVLPPGWEATIDECANMILRPA